MKPAMPFFKNIFIHPTVTKTEGPRAGFLTLAYVKIHSINHEIYEVHRYSYALMRDSMKPAMPFLKNIFIHPTVTKMEGRYSIIKQLPAMTKGGFLLILRNRVSLWPRGTFFYGAKNLIVKKCEYGRMDIPNYTSTYIVPDQALVSFGWRHKQP